jgi:hypothetical protein
MSATGQRLGPLDDRSFSLPWQSEAVSDLRASRIISHQMTDTGTSPPIKRPPIFVMAHSGPRFLRREVFTLVISTGNENNGPTSLRLQIVRKRSGRTRQRHTHHYYITLSKLQISSKMARGTSINIKQGTLRPKSVLTAADLPCREAEL